MYVSRDPFAREELHKERVNVDKDTCEWCGSVKLDRWGNKFLYQYRIESDGGRSNEIQGLFCSVDCMRSYYG